MEKFSVRGVRNFIITVKEIYQMKNGREAGVLRIESKKCTVGGYVCNKIYWNHPSNRRSTEMIDMEELPETAFIDMNLNQLTKKNRLKWNADGGTFC
jgi:hypothetical protein